MREGLKDVLLGPAQLYEALRDKGITEREANVIELLGQGLSNADISARLFLSVRTVAGHVSSLLSKTGADNRTALVAWYLDIS